MINGYLSSDVHSIPLGYFIDLVSMLGRPKNRFMINKIFHEAKANVSIDKYSGNAKMDDYLDHKILEQWGDGSRTLGPTVRECVRIIVCETAKRTGKYCWLTRRVGQRFAVFFGWKDLFPSIEVMQ